MLIRQTKLFLQIKLYTSSIVGKYSNINLLQYKDLFQWKVSYLLGLCDRLYFLASDAFCANQVTLIQHPNQIFQISISGENKLCNLTWEYWSKCILLLDCFLCLTGFACVASQRLSGLLVLKLRGNWNTEFT